MLKDIIYDLKFDKLFKNWKFKVVVYIKKIKKEEFMLWLNL